MALRIVRSGTWRYDNTVARPVDIIGLDYDFWYELARRDDLLEPGEQPEPLSPDGYLYYVRFRCAGEISEPTWVDSPAHGSVDRAVNDAQGQVLDPIAWSQSPSQVLR